MHTGFSSFHQFIAMGGYAKFVWPSFAVVAVVMIGNVLHTVLQNRSATKVEASTIVGLENE